MNKMSLVMMLAVIVAAVCAEVKALYNRNSGSFGSAGNYVYEGTCLSMVQNDQNLAVMVVLLSLAYAAAFVIFH